MPTIRFSRLAIAAGLLVAGPFRLHAQTFVEAGGGGWNEVAVARTPIHADANHSDGLNLRASIGRRLAAKFLIRLDAVSNQFNVRVPHAQNAICPANVVCPSYFYETHPERANGLLANALVNIDPRGFLYLIGGAGLYDVDVQVESGVPPIDATEWHLGLSGGAGITVPLILHLRFVGEVRWHALYGGTSGSPWFIPVTVGLRY